MADVAVLRRERQPKPEVHCSTLDSAQTESTAVCVHGEIRSRHTKEVPTSCGLHNVNITSIYGALLTDFSQQQSCWSNVTHYRYVLIYFTSVLPTIDSDIECSSRHVLATRLHDCVGKSLRCFCRYIIMGTRSNSIYPCNACLLNNTLSGN